MQPSSSETLRLCSRHLRPGPCPCPALSSPVPVSSQPVPVPSPPSASGRCAHYVKPPRGHEDQSPWGVQCDHQRLLRGLTSPTRGKKHRPVCSGFVEGGQPTCALRARARSPPRWKVPESRSKKRRARDADGEILHSSHSVPVVRSSFPKNSF